MSETEATYDAASVSIVALLSVPCPTCGEPPDWITLCCREMAAVHLEHAGTCRECDLVLCPRCAPTGRCAGCRGEEGGSSDG